MGSQGKQNEHRNKVHREDHLFKTRFQIHNVHILEEGSIKTLKLSSNYTKELKETHECISIKIAHINLNTKGM